MNITVGDYTIQHTSGAGCYIWKKETGVVTIDTTIVSPRTISSELASLSYDRALFKMQTAYETGEWPTDRCPHCGK